jgi:hypothetical protein
MPRNKETDNKRSGINARMEAAGRILDETDKEYSAARLLAAHDAIHRITGQAIEAGLFSRDDALEKKLGVTVYAARIARNHGDFQTARDLDDLHDEVLARENNPPIEDNPL